MLPPVSDQSGVPILTSTEECLQINALADEAHESALEGNSPNYGRLITSRVYNGWFHDSLGASSTYKDWKHFMVAGCPAPLHPHEVIKCQSNARNNRATALRDMGCYQAAAKEYDELHDIQRDFGISTMSQTLVNYSNLHRRAGNFEQANETARRAVAAAASFYRQALQFAQEFPGASADEAKNDAEGALINALNQVFEVYHDDATRMEATNLDEAAMLREGVVLMFEQFLGSTHRETQSVRSEIAAANDAMHRRAMKK